MKLKDPEDKFQSKTLRQTIEYLVAGGAAGAIARTCVSPVERVKIIYQVKKGGGYGGILPELVREEARVARSRFASFVASEPSGAFCRRSA